MPVKLCALWIAMLLVPTVSTAQDAEPRPRVLVWDISDARIPAPSRITLLETLVAQLDTHASWLAEPPPAELKDELETARAGCAASLPTCSSEAARLAGVEQLLVARLARERGNLRLTLWWFNAGTAAAVAEHEGSFRRDLERTDSQLALERLLATLPRPVETEVVDISATPDGTAPATATDSAGTELSAAPSESDDDATSPSMEASWAEDEATWRVDEPEAELLHAHAAIAEARGELTGARELLRRALALAPDDPLIAFDLARLVVEQPQGALAEDAEAFLAAPGTDHDSQLLLAHLLWRRGEQEQAGELAAALSAQTPENVELTRLHALLTPRAAATAKSWRAQVRASAQADSNVSVLPEDNPTHLVGLRSGAEGAVNYTPTAGRWNGDFGLRLSAAAHLNDREELALYDLASGALLLRNRIELGRFRLLADLSASEIFIDSFAEQFLQELGGRLQLSLTLAGWEMGLLGRVAARDFVYANPEGSLDDRDGPSLQGGMIAAGRLGPVRLRITAGALAELAQGARQAVQGALANLDATTSFGPLRAEAGVGYQLRNYPRSRRQLGPDAEERTDQRLTPYLRLGYALSESYGLFASYTFVRNLSLDRFDYARHLGQLGAEATW